MFLFLHGTNIKVYIVGASREMWRINLYQGRFMGGWETALGEINVYFFSSPARLLCFVTYCRFSSDTIH